MMRAVKAGGNRQELHEVIREAAMKAWSALADGGENPLGASLGRRRAFTCPILIRPRFVRCSIRRIISGMHR